jgi:hypothetical protein
MMADKTKMTADRWKVLAKLFDLVWDPKKETGEKFHNRLVRMCQELAAMGHEITLELVCDVIWNATRVSIPNFLDGYTTEDLSMDVVFDAFFGCCPEEGRQEKETRWN